MIPEAQEITETHKTVLRRTFVMSVRPGKFEEFKARYSAVWPELIAALKEASVSNYSIFYHHTTRQVFVYLEIQNEDKWTALGNAEVWQRWWFYLRDVIAMNEPDGPAMAKLSEVFHIR